MQLLRVHIPENVSNLYFVLHTNQRYYVFLRFITKPLLQIITILLHYYYILLVPLFRIITDHYYLLLRIIM